MIPILIFLTSLFSTFLSSMSGGGSGTINLPVFLWAGIPLPLAIAIQKVSAVFWTPVSAFNYLKGRTIDWVFLFLFGFIGMFGAYLGVQVITFVDEDILARVIGGILLFFVIWTASKKSVGLREQKICSPFKRRLSYFAALVMGFYDAILGSGNGIAFATITFYTRGFDLVHALGYYFAVAFFWVFVSASLLIYEGYFDWKLMLASVLGSVLGSFLGSKLARFKGNRFIKRVFIVVGTLLALKLLVG